MKIVLIARNIFPLLSPRAFRTTELAKELAHLGHDVTIYAVLGEYDYTSFTKTTHVKVKNIPMTFSTANSDGKCRYNIIDKVLFHAFHRIFEFPDVEFVWKVISILKKESKIDMLITIAYPHPIHWGAALAKFLNKDTFAEVWISDCGDPYMGDTVNKKHPFYFRWVENFWGKQTDYITIPIEEGRKGYSPAVQDKIRIIPQGFNFKDIKIDKAFKGNSIPHFAYAGTIYPGVRDPTKFLEFLCELDIEFVFTVYTKAFSFYEPYKKKLMHKLVLKPYIPREKLIFELSQQDFLINLTNPNTTQSPSKLIDYYLTQRPIIDISLEFPDSEVFEQFLQKDYSARLKVMDIEQFNIINVAKAFLRLK